jgi:hypothetical protein
LKRQFFNGFNNVSSEVGLVAGSDSEFWCAVPDVDTGAHWKVGSGSGFRQHNERVRVNNTSMYNISICGKHNTNLRHNCYGSEFLAVQIRIRALHQRVAVFSVFLIYRDYIS